MRTLKMLMVVSFVAAFVYGLIGGPAVLSADEDSELEKAMKPIGEKMKALKQTVAMGKNVGVKENAEYIAANVGKAKDHEPPINKDRKAEIPALADEAIAAAKALAAAEGTPDVKAKFFALGNSCKKCHDIFQPEE
ncbi:MAG: hypothetical protein M5R36_00975 [Deltaproteobacteria bacterium]|nr:hypothetical protein [Deltaproteobacteria bacterium]